MGNRVIELDAAIFRENFMKTSKPNNKGTAAIAQVGVFSLLLTSHVAAFAAAQVLSLPPVPITATAVKAVTNDLPLGSRPPHQRHQVIKAPVRPTPSLPSKPQVAVFYRR